MHSNIPWIHFYKGIRQIKGRLAGKQRWIRSNHILEKEYGRPSCKVFSFIYVGYSLSEKKKIVLYGAGNVGRSYFRQFTYYKNVDLVAWVDRSLCGQIIYDF